MSCEECRCDDLSRLRPRLESISDAYKNVCNQYTVLASCQKNVEIMGDEQTKVFEADNRFEVQQATMNIFNRIRPRLDILKSELGDLKSEMEKIESDMSKEDHEYHEAERRSRENAAEEERHRINAARAASGR